MFVNKLIVAVRLAEEVGFPDFPLSINNEQAERLVDVLGDEKTNLLTALMGRHLTHF